MDYDPSMEGSAGRRDDEELCCVRCHTLVAVIRDARAAALVGDTVCRSCAHPTYAGIAGAFPGAA